MPIESASFVSQLNSANPPIGDDFGEGDDHLRMIKACIRATWPNMTAIACTPSTVEFNHLVGVTSSIQTQFTAQTALSALKANLASPTFTGTVTIPSGAVISGYASLASPAFTGFPTAPTLAAGNNTTSIATTAFVIAQGLSSALPGQAGNAGKYIRTDGTTATWQDPFASSPLTGVPTAPTAIAGTNTTQIATTAFTAANFAALVSPAFTGTPSAPTAAVGTNTTQVATTAFALAVAGGYVADAIGTYVYGYTNTISAAFGATTPGTNIQPSAAVNGGSLNNSGTSLSGTWRCMGNSGSSLNNTLYVRIA